MDKITINNQVVKMRKFAKQAKVHAINKLVKQAKFLQNRKGNDVQIQKAKRRAERYLEEIKILKKMKPDHVSKMALSKAKNWNEILKQKNFELEERCLAILANYTAIQKEVENFHSANPSLTNKILNFFKEWEEKSKLPKELRKNKNILNSSNFTDINKSDLNFENSSKNARKRGKFDLSKANKKTEMDEVNIGTLNNDKGEKFRKTKIQKGSETKNNKQSSGFFKKKHQLLLKKETDLSKKSDFTEESDENESNITADNIEEDSDVDEDISGGSGCEVDEIVSEKDNGDIDLKNAFVQKGNKNMKNVFEKNSQNKVRGNASEVDDSDIGDNVSEKDYDSEVKDNASEKGDSSEVEENVPEKIYDSELEENLSGNDFDSEDIDNASIKSDSDINEDDSEKDNNIEMDSAAFRKDVNLSSNIDSPLNKNNMNSVKKVKLSKEANKSNAKFHNRTTAQATEDIIKSSTKDHVKTISVLNLDDLEGLDEIPIEKMSDDEIDNDIEEQNLEETNDPFFLRSGEVTSFTDDKPERDSFSLKHDRSNVAKNFDKNKNESFRNKFGRNSDGNRSYNEKRDFRKNKFQRNQYPNFKKNFQKSGSDHKSFNREKEFNKNFQSKNQEKFQQKKIFLPKSSYNTGEQSGAMRTMDKQSFRDNSSFNRGREFNKKNFQQKTQGKREFLSKSSFNKEQQSSFGKKINKHSFQDTSSKFQFKGDHARPSFKNAKFQNKKGNETSDAPLHPSWEAKRKQKELTHLSFQGKRMVFND